MTFLNDPLEDIEEPQGLVGHDRVDITPFKQKMTAAERRELIAQTFPSTASLNWEKAFDRDADLLGRVLKDILKLDQVVPGKGAGRHPDLNVDQAEPVLDRIRGINPADRSYSKLPFSATLRILAGERSERSLAAKTGLAKTRVHRLLTGEETPHVSEMEAISAAFGKQPSYFLEYRVRSITAAVYGQLAETPDVSISVYERMYHATG